MKKQVKMSSDQISDLPDHIKQYILSLLDIKDAVRTSVLSRRWKHEWNWLPRLTFKIEDLPNDLRLEDKSLMISLSKKWQQTLVQRREAFLDFQERTLVRRCTMTSPNILQKLSLFVPVSSIDASRIDTWLACAIDCHVRKLGLHISSGENNNWYRLPDSVLASRSLTWLKLYNCSIISKYPSVIKLSSLQTMSLFLVYVDEETLCKMIASCPAIRKLSLVYCYGFKELEVSGTSKLEEVNISDTVGLEKVSLHAKHLESFSIEGCNSPGQIDIATCKNIRRLILKEVAITNYQLSFHLAFLPQLQHLYLVGCDLLQSFKIHAESLNHLTLEHCRKLVEAEIDAPNLVSFMYQARSMLSLSLNAPVVARAVINLSYRRLDDLWHDRFIKFLKKFNHAVTLSLFITPNTGMLIPQDWRQRLCPPLFNVKHMKTEVRYASKNANSLAEAVESILWLSPHIDSITISSICNEIKFHFLYKEPIISETVHTCCSSIPMKCWRHCLKEVKIDNLKNPEDGAHLKTLFGNAETLERIEGLPL